MVGIYPGMGRLMRSKMDLQVCSEIGVDGLRNGAPQRHAYKRNRHSDPRWTSDHLGEKGGEVRLPCCGRAPVLAEGISAPGPNFYDGGDQARGAERCCWPRQGHRQGGAAGPPPHLAMMRVT